MANYPEKPEFVTTMVELLKRQGEAGQQLAALIRFGETDLIGRLLDNFIEFGPGHVTLEHRAAKVLKEWEDSHEQ